MSPDIINYVSITASSWCSEQLLGHIGSKSTGILSWETDQGRHVAALCCLVFWHWEFVQLALQCRGSPRLDKLEAGPYPPWLGYGTGTHVWLAVQARQDFEWLDQRLVLKFFLDHLHMIFSQTLRPFSWGIVFYSFLILPECRKPKRCQKSGLAVRMLSCLTFSQVFAECRSSFDL